MSRKPNSECQIMVFRPTMEEFSDFSRYIQYIESQGAHRGGVAKIIPPKEWVASHTYDNIDNLLIPAPISQVVTGQKGLFTQYNIQQKAMTVKELRRLANMDKYSSPFHESYDDLERTYWKNITFNPAIYGADISGSLYDKDVDIWNVARLNTILDLIENDTGVKIEGVNTAYLYFGMWKTSFAWHTEDMDLYSINFVHFGAPKSWYAIPPEHGKRLERLANGFFPNSYSTCPAFLRHKMTLISPSVLRQYGIPCNKITQEAGEFMITFPYGYHSGFNHGFNCAESTNFASERWINYGIAAEKCRCRTDMVYINMDLFVKSFKPEQYEEWKAKKHELKLSYTDIPPVPDFTKKRVHWRERIKQIKKEYQSSVKSSSQQSCAKSPSKHCDTTPASSSKHQTNSKASIFAKLPQIKIMREPISESMQQNVVSPKKSPKRDKLNESKLPESPPVPSGSSGCLVVPNTGYQLKMGVVLQDFALDRDVKHQVQEVNDVPAPHFATLFDRIKMKRRRASDKNLTADVCLSDHKYASEQQITRVTEMKKENQPTYMSETHCETTEEYFTSQNQSQAGSSCNSNSELLSKRNFKQGMRPFVKLLDFSQGKDSQKQKDSSSKISGQQDAQTSADHDTKTYNPWSEDEDSLSTSSDTDFSEKNVSSEDSSETKTEITKTRMSKGTMTMVFNRPPLKRRHPVSKKGPSKKSSPTVVLKNVSAESESSDDERRNSVSERGRPRVNKQLTTDVDGYDSLRPKRKINFKHERQFNATVAKLPPHCAVCTLFKPYYQRPLTSSDKPLPLATLLEKFSSAVTGTRTQPLIPEVNFATSINNPAPLATCELLDNEGQSVLLQCNTCMVQVHASCYGIEKPPENPKAWTCDRCSFKAYVAQCCLCYMRGGALKPVNDGLQWAHVLCAVAIPEVFFDDVRRRNGINVRNLSPTRQKLKCTYCKRNNSRNYQSVGTCIQCCAGACAVSFHPTCAHAAGVKMEPGDWPLPVFIYCHRHALQKERAMQTKVNKILPEVEINQTVYGKHRNGRYYPCRVTSKSSQTFHHVIFEDNSWSDNLFQDDIVNHSFDRDGPLKEGDHVEVLWTDGKVYSSKYVRCKKHQVVAVEFEDGSCCSIKREDVYVNMEDMPKRIKRKLSTATNMSKLDYLESPKTSVGESYVSQRAAYNQKKRKSSRLQSDMDVSLG